jgi:hypothetical protein
MAGAVHGLDDVQRKKGILTGWVHLSVGGREGSVPIRFSRPAGPWAEFGAGLNRFPAAFSYFFILFHFLFPFSKF